MDLREAKQTLNNIDWKKKKCSNDRGSFITHPLYTDFLFLPIVFWHMDGRSSVDCQDINLEGYFGSDFFSLIWNRNSCEIKSGGRNQSYGRKFPWLKGFMEYLRSGTKPQEQSACEKLVTPVKEIFCHFSTTCTDKINFKMWLEFSKGISVTNRSSRITASHAAVRVRFPVPTQHPEKFRELLICNGNLSLESQQQLTDSTCWPQVTPKLAG